MDGVMFMHSPGAWRVILREFLDDGHSVGPDSPHCAPRSGFYAEARDFFCTNIRANGALEPTGSASATSAGIASGSRCGRCTGVMPESVRGRILSQSENLAGRPSAPVEFAATLFYPGGVTVEFYASFMAAIQQWVYVSGQKAPVAPAGFYSSFRHLREPGNNRGKRKR